VRKSSKLPRLTSVSAVNDKGDKGRWEATLATAEGKPLKVEAHGRHRHETRPEGFGAEESVKRLRKPEGVA
jgi:hypothetical protein